MKSSVQGAVVVLLLSASLGFAADQTVLGRRMVVSDPLPGVNPKQRTFLVVAKERPPDDTVVGDPIANGATLQVIVNGATSTSQTFDLPPGPPPTSVGPGWVGKSIPGSLVVFKYKDKNGEATPVTYLRLRWRAARYFQIKVKANAQGNNPPIDVVPGNPTSDLGIRLTLGGGDTYCVLFGGSAGGAIVDAADATFVKASRPTGEGCPVAP